MKLTDVETMALDDVVKDHDEARVYTAHERLEDLALALIVGGVDRLTEARNALQVLGDAKTCCRQSRLRAHVEFAGCRK